MWGREEGSYKRLARKHNGTVGYIIGNVRITERHREKEVQRSGDVDLGEAWKTLLDLKAKMRIKKYKYTP